MIATPAARVLALLNSIALVASANLQTCGNAQYDPSKYVCWNGDFLCPIVAGEPLSYCNGACYSKCMYTCSNNALALLPAVSQGTPFTLTASNPQVPAIDGVAVTACNQHWSIGGTTCTYCPEQAQPNCPPGNYTAMTAQGAMDAEVPGGQIFYLDAYWNVGYTQAHSASIPPGSTTGGITAYHTGCLVNLNSGGRGWVACPPGASGGGGTAWNLVAKNQSNAAILTGCSAVNLKVTELPQGTFAAWQYT